MPDENTQVSRINGKINMAQQDISVLQDRWLEYYKLYRNWRDSQTIQGRSNVGIPLAFEWVEVVKSRLFDIFFGKRPYVRVKGQEPSDDFNARLVQQYQNYQYDLAGYRKLGYDILTQTLIYGTGIAKIAWRFDEQEKVVNVPIFADALEMGSVPKKMKVPVYDNVSLDLVDVFDFFVDPNATSIEDAEWAAHRTRRTLAYLEEKEEQGIYKNISALKLEMSGENVETGGIETEIHKQEILNIEGHLQDKGMLLKPITIMEFWDKSDNTITTIANSKHIIREGDNPYEHGRLPFVIGKIISTPHEFYGIGLIEAGAPSARIMEDLLNNGLDNMNFAINPITGVDRNRVEDTELVSRPGAFFHTLGPPREALWPMVIPDTSGSTLAWFNLMNDLAKRGTGVNDYVVGQASGAKTATEATLLTNEAAKRIGLHIKMFGMSFINKLAELVYALDGQFVTRDQVVRVTGLEGDAYEVVTPETFGANIDFVFESEDREMNNIQSVQQLMQMLGIAQTHPILAQFIPIIFEKVLEKYDMHENEELKQAAKFAKEMAPAYQALVMQQMAQAGQPSGAGGGVGNAPRPAGGGNSSDTNQSLNAQSTSNAGSLPVG